MPTALPIKLRSHGTLQRRAAFTLVEILVVVAIMSLLVGIGIAVGVRAQRSAVNNACKITLGQAQAVVDAYTFKFNDSTHPFINWTGTSPENWNQSKAKNKTGVSGSAVIGDVDSIERFVYVTYPIPECRTILEAMGQQVFLDSDDNGFMDIVDPWGKKLVYRDATYNGAAVSGESGSELPRHNSPYFASSGPDGKWGNWSELQKKRQGTSYDATQAANAEDNLYSFDLK